MKQGYFYESLDTGRWIWNTITPEVPLEEPEELPWWLGVLGVAALVLLFYLLSASQTT